MALLVLAQTKARTKPPEVRGKNVALMRGGGGRAVSDGVHASSNGSDGATITTPGGIGRDEQRY